MEMYEVVMGKSGKEFSVGRFSNWETVVKAIANECHNGYQNFEYSICQYELNEEKKEFAFLDMVQATYIEEIDAIEFTNSFNQEDCLYAADTLVKIA